MKTFRVVAVSLLAFFQGCADDSDTESNADSDSDSTVDTDVGFDTSTTDEVDSGVDTNDGLGCAENRGRLDEETNLCWQYPKPAGELGWKAAMSYCENLSLGGHDDWSLPSRQDLIGLFDDCDSVMGTGGVEIMSCMSCSLSSKCSKLFGSASGWVWSIDPSPADCETGYTCGFHAGSVGYDCRDTSGVRCVRSEK